MVHENRFLPVMAGVVLLCLLMVIPRPGFSGPMPDGPPLPAEEGAALGRDPNILVEVFLSHDHRGQVEEIKKEFERISIKRTRIQFFRLGNPPQNVAIGKNVPADVARGVMLLAIRYNQGIQYLISEFQFFHDYAAIGTSAFDEASQIPIRPADLERLRDPALTTPQFHQLYRSLTGEDKSDR